MTLTPSAIKWASPNFGTFLAHSGLKWSVRQILPPLLGWNKNVILQTVLASRRKQKEQKNKRTCTSLPSCHLVQGLPLQEPSRDTWPESSNRVGFKKDINRFKEYIYVPYIQVMDFKFNFHKVLTSNSMSNSYLRSSWMYQHFPNHLQWTGPFRQYNFTPQTEKVWLFSSILSI